MEEWEINFEWLRIRNQIKDAFNKDIIDILTNRKNNLLDKNLGPTSFTPLLSSGIGFSFLILLTILLIKL